jgi:hypothetical protein
MLFDVPQNAVYRFLRVNFWLRYAPKQHANRRLLLKQYLLLPYPFQHLWNLLWFKRLALSCLAQRLPMLQQDLSFQHLQCFQIAQRNNLLYQ